jgi:hypothetical protein
VKSLGSRKRALERWAEAIQPELRELRSPAPDDRLFDRIATSRAQGVRVILPDVAPTRRRSPVRFFIAAGVAAVLITLMIPFWRVTRTSSREGGASVNVGRSAVEWLPSAVAYAQPDLRRGVPTLPAMEFRRANRLRPIALEYLRTWRDSAAQNAGRITTQITLRDTTSDGVRAWSFVSRNTGVRNGHALLAIDSAMLARSDLRLLRHTVIERPYSRYDEIRIAQSFAGDSLTGGMQATGARASPASRPIARKLPRTFAPYILDAAGPLLLSAVELDADWSASASVLGWAVRDDNVFVPIEMRVVGEEVVSVPAGRFDCWRILIRYGNHAISYWARKSDGVGVRNMDIDPSGLTREVVLVRESSLGTRG